MPIDKKINMENLNRIIKFRAWGKINKKIIHNPICNDICKTEYIDLNEVINRFKTNGFILMQFTGLSDKLGIEIYEGDIVSFPWINPMGELEDEHSYYGKIIFENSVFIIRPIKADEGYYGDTFLKNYLKKGETKTINKIIGNIYENKNLLNQ